MARLLPGRRWSAVARRHEDRLAQARCDIEGARGSLDAGGYEGRAFQAQEGAGKSVRGLLSYRSLEVTGHRLVDLLREVGQLVEVPGATDERAPELDVDYLQGRCPNRFAEGYPAELYDEATASKRVESGEGLTWLVEKGKC